MSLLVSHLYMAALKELPEKICLWKKVYKIDKYVNYPDLTAIQYSHLSKYHNVPYQYVNY